MSKKEDVVYGGLEIRDDFKPLMYARAGGERFLSDVNSSKHVRERKEDSTASSRLYFKTLNKERCPS